MSNQSLTKTLNQHTGIDRNGQGVKTTTPYRSMVCCVIQLSSDPDCHLRVVVVAFGLHSASDTGCKAILVG